MSPTVKSSVSLQKELWEKLKKHNNKSRVINVALEMFFEQEKYLKEAKDDYWRKVEASLRGENDDYVTLNSGDTAVTEEILEENLWK